jgi:23S rRNA pseudouridine1911/1915/1917 synthase
MAERLHVAESGRLLAFLRQALPGWKRKTLEQRIAAGSVRVNGNVPRSNAPVTPGDEVTVGDEVPDGSPTLPFPVLFQDPELVAIDKPAGLLAVSSAREHEHTALALVRAALSQPRRPAKLWPVHRLDRETSGVLLFARTQVAREAVQARWDEVAKKYVAIVEGRPEPSEGVIDIPLFEGDGLRVHAGKLAGAKEARTRYRVLENRGERSRLEVWLETGRKHQIRVHLAARGWPVVGDERYGTKDERLGLHAERLVVPHPRDGRTLVIEAEVPREVVRLLE